MGLSISVIKNLYRTFLPVSLRRSSAVARLKSRLLGHEWIYDSEYYDSTVELTAVRSAQGIASSLLSNFKAAKAIDVGCGTGALLEALRNGGWEVFGLEYSEAGLKYCRARGLNVAKFNLERDAFIDDRTFDVAISMEVAEHLPEVVADRYVDLLTALSQVIVFTAAQPGQGGQDHVNEQPPSYWITKFQQRGFEYDEELSQRLRESWKVSGAIESWYYQNLLIFQQGRAL